MSKSEKEKSQRLEELRAEIKRHNELYYRQAQPEITDQAYDQKRRELDNLQAELDPLGLFATTSHDDLKNAKPCGDDRLDAFTSHRHLQPMLSLDNTYDEQEFFELISSATDFLALVISLTWWSPKLMELRFP